MAHLETNQMELVKLKHKKKEEKTISQNLCYQIVSRKQEMNHKQKELSFDTDDSLYDEEQAFKQKNRRLKETVNQQEDQITRLCEDIQDLKRQERENKLLKFSINKLQKKWKESRQIW